MLHPITESAHISVQTLDFIRFLAPSRSLTLYPAELRALTDCIVPTFPLFVKGFVGMQSRFVLGLFEYFSSKMVFYSIFCSILAFKKVCNLLIHKVFRQHLNVPFFVPIESTIYHKG